MKKDCVLPACVDDQRRAHDTNLCLWKRVANASHNGGQVGCKFSGGHVMSVCGGAISTAELEEHSQDIVASGHRQSLECCLQICQGKARREARVATVKYICCRTPRIIAR